MWTHTLAMSAGTSVCHGPRASTPEIVCHLTVSCHVLLWIRFVSQIQIWHVARLRAKAIVFRTCVLWRRLARLGRFAKKKGIDGKPIRWFSDHDTSSHNINYRYARMILCDFVVVLQNASPYQNNNICFWDSLADVFNKTEQSMAAACHILRDKYMFLALTHS